MVEKKLRLAGDLLTIRTIISVPIYSSGATITGVISGFILAIRYNTRTQSREA